MNLKVYSTFHRQFCGWFGMKNQNVNFKKIELAKSNQIKSIYTKFLFSAAFFFLLEYGNSKWQPNFQNEFKFSSSIVFTDFLVGILFLMTFSVFYECRCVRSLVYGDLNSAPDIFRHKFTRNDQRKKTVSWLLLLDAQNWQGKSSWQVTVIKNQLDFQFFN